MINIKNIILYFGKLQSEKAAVQKDITVDVIFFKKTKYI